MTRSAAIRLVPPGVVIPPDGLKPAFTFTPTAPLDHQNVLFDASTSAPAAGIAEYRWSFGDGRTGTGRTAVHAFDTPATYAVTLTISDAFGRTAFVTQSITVGAGAAPTAAFVFSPTSPLPGQQVNFNASSSRATPGQSIASYSWDFGDGGGGQGVQPSHSFAAAGTYNVTLVITDTAGRVGSVSQAVNVGTQGNPTASFVFSPTNPRVGDSVTFNGSASSAATGRTIVSYRWDFGDGTSGTGQTTSHVYGTARTYTVVLTVTDDTGKTGTSTMAVTIAP
jgi:PKD repeat protein